MLTLTRLALAILLLGTTQASFAHIVDIVMDDVGSVFLLGDKGNVWAYSVTNGIPALVPLPNLTNIKTLAPYIALDKYGRVFIWDLDEGKTNYLEDAGAAGIIASYTVPQEIVQLKNVTHIASDGRFRFLAVEREKNLYLWDRKYRQEAKATGRKRPFKLLNSRSGVQAIAISQAAIGVTYRDNRFFSWPQEENARISQYPDGHKIVRSLPLHATSISFSTNQTSILLADGHVAYLGGGCDFDPLQSAEDGKWHFIYKSQTMLRDVINIASDSSNSIEPFIAVIKDGSVWSADTMRYGKDAFGGDDCGRGTPYSFVRIAGMTTPAVKAVIGAGLIFALGYDHSVWMTDTVGDDWANNQFKKLEVQ